MSIISVNNLPTSEPSPDDHTISIYACSHFDSNFGRRLVFGGDPFALHFYHSSHGPPGCGVSRRYVSRSRTLAADQCSHSSTRATTCRLRQGQSTDTLRQSCVPWLSVVAGIQNHPRKQPHRRNRASLQEKPHSSRHICDKPWQIFQPSRTCSRQVHCYARHRMGS